MGTENKDGKMDRNILASSRMEKFTESGLIYGKTKIVRIQVNGERI